MTATDWTARRAWYREQYLNSRYWRWVRRIIARRAKRTCEVQGCKKQGWNLNAHHTTHRILYLEWAVPWKLVYLCPTHHGMTHGGQWLRLRRGLFGVWLRPYSGK